MGFFDRLKKKLRDILDDVLHRDTNETEVPSEVNQGTAEITPPVEDVIKPTQPKQEEHAVLRAPVKHEDKPDVVLTRGDESADEIARSINEVLERRKKLHEREEHLHRTEREARRANEELDRNLYLVEREIYSLKKQKEQLASAPENAEFVVTLGKDSHGRYIQKTMTKRELESFIDKHIAELERTHSEMEQAKTHNISVLKKVSEALVDIDIAKHERIIQPTESMLEFMGKDRADTLAEHAKLMIESPAYFEAQTKEMHPIAQSLGGIALGAIGGAVLLTKSTARAITHPVETAERAKMFITHPVSSLTSFARSTYEAFQTHPTYMFGAMLGQMALMEAGVRTIGRPISAGISRRLSAVNERLAQATTQLGLKGRFVELNDRLAMISEQGILRFRTLTGKKEFDISARQYVSGEKATTLIRGVGEDTMFEHLMKTQTAVEQAGSRTLIDTEKHLMRAESGFFRIRGMERFAMRDKYLRVMESDISERMFLARIYESKDKLGVALRDRQLMFAKYGEISTPFFEPTVFGRKGIEVIEKDNVGRTGTFWLLSKDLGKLERSVKYQLEKVLPKHEAYGAGLMLESPKTRLKRSIDLYYEQLRMKGKISGRSVEEVMPRIKQLERLEARIAEANLRLAVARVRKHLTRVEVPLSAVRIPSMSLAIFALPRAKQFAGAKSVITPRISFMVAQVPKLKSLMANIQAYRYAQRVVEAQTYGTRLEQVPIVPKPPRMPRMRVPRALRLPLFKLPSAGLAKSSTKYKKVRTQYYYAPDIYGFMFNVRAPKWYKKSLIATGLEVRGI